MQQETICCECLAPFGAAQGGIGRIRMSVDPDRCSLAGTFDPPLASGWDRTSPTVTERVYIDTYPF